jgi:hypothetical protein
MALSLDTAKRLMIALGKQSSGNEAAGILNNDVYGMPLVIVATSVSTTVNFSGLQVGDLLVHIPATAGNAAFEKIVTANTKPSAAVVGDLYIAVRLAVPLTNVL